MRRLTAFAACMLFALSLAPMNLVAMASSDEQVQVGSVVGTATTGTGSTFPTATVQLIDSTTGAVVQTTSTGAEALAGTFGFSGVAPGTYVVSIVQTVTINGVATNVVVGLQTVTVVAGAATTITVTTTAAAMTAFTTSLAGSALAGVTAGAGLATAAGAAVSAAAAGSAGAAILITSGTGITAGIVASAISVGTLTATNNDTSPSR